MHRAAKLLILSLLIATSAEASTIGRVATSMAPGTWAVVPATHTPVENLFDIAPGFTDSMCWNPKLRMIVYQPVEHVGPPPDDGPNPKNLAVFDDDSNTWDVSRPAPFADHAFHTYDHQACDEENERFYFRQYNTDNIYRYCFNAGCPGSQSAGTWAQIPSPSGAVKPATQCCGSISFAPFIDGGTLLYFDADNFGSGTGGLYAYREATQGWVRLSDSIENGAYHTFMECSRVKRVCVFGGGNGSGRTYRIDENKTIVELEDFGSSIMLGIANRNLVEDPVTGNFVMIWGDGGGQGEFWQLDPDNVSNSWTLLDGDLTGTGEICDTIRDSSAGCAGHMQATPVVTYGVMAFWDFNAGGSGGSQLWLYKHADWHQWPTQSFTARCAASGVLWCEGFDTQGAIDDYYTAGPDGVRAFLDTSVKASGSGSIRFEVRSQSPANSSGDWDRPFGVTFSENSVFYIQARTRMNSVMATFNFEPGNGWKQFNFHRTGATCDEAEITTQNTFLRGYPQMYHNCGSGNPTGESACGDSCFDPTLSGDIYHEHSRGSAASPVGYNCAHNGTWNATNCALYSDTSQDAWATYYWEIKIGTWGDANSEVRAWIQKDGQTPKQFMHAIGLALLEPGNGPTSGFQQIWIGPYHTNKDDTQVHSTGLMWYDEIVVSKTPIAPADATGVAGVPEPPTNFRIIF